MFRTNTLWLSGIISLILLLLILLGDTHLFSYIYFFVFILLLLHDLIKFKKPEERKFYFEQLNTRSVILHLLFCFFSFSLAISCIFSLSLPLSIQKYLTILPGIYFLLLAQTSTKKLGNAFFLAVLSTSLVLFCFSFFLLFFPNSLTLLPQMNLLVANYGHNHANLFFLMSIPISWYFWSRQKYKIQSIFMLFLLIFTVGVIFSFGRVAATLALATIFLYMRKTKFMENRLRILSFFALAVPLLISVSFFITSSFAPNILSTQFCIIPSLKRQICKYAENEARRYYWIQAIEGISEHPLKGSGLNTFLLISKKNAEQNSQVSGYVHNEYLQIILETGLILGSIILISYYLLYASIVKKLFKSNFALNQENTAGILILLIGLDAFFNYNLSYTSIQAIFLFVIGIFLQNLQKRSSQKDFFTFEQSVLQYFKKFCLSFRVLLCICIIFWCSLFLFGEYLYSKNLVVEYLKFFPFEEKRVIHIIRNYELSSSEYLLIKTLYKNHGEVLKALVQLGTQEKNSLIETAILSIEPRDIQTRSKYMEKLYADQNWPELNIQFETIHKLYKPEDRWQINSSLKTFRDKINKDVSLQLLPKEKRVWLLSSLYSKNSELFAIEPPIYFVNPGLFDDSEIQLFTDRSDPHYLGMASELIKPWYLGRIQSLISQEKWSEANTYIIHLYKIADWYRWDIWNTISPTFQNKCTEYSLAGNKERAKEVLDEWLIIGNQLSGNKPEQDVIGNWYQEIEYCKNLTK